MYRKLVASLHHVWSTTRFGAKELSNYAHYMMIEETRKGLAAMSAVALLLLCAQTVLYAGLGFGYTYLYTSVLLALLAAHVFVSARLLKDLNSLYLLGMSLLVVCGTAFVLLAHKTGTFSLALFAGVALLFMVIPMVPWGLREAFAVTMLIYSVFTLSTVGNAARFEREALWALQLVMAGAGIISLALVTRNASVRKSDILARFELENAHKRMTILSNKDPLTGAWNRRYLMSNFASTVERWRKEDGTYHYALLDVDDFKPLNDTYGHDYGDRILKAVVVAFQEPLKEHGYLVRMGGDEFALLFTAADPETLVGSGFARLREHLGCSSQPGGETQAPEISVSVGLVSVPPNVHASEDTLYRAADQALYEAKARKSKCRGEVHFVACKLTDPETAIRTLAG
ncbi:MAG: GGDEF domain-containing protein [Gammaproteobacteria bacterium]|nr:GGDEF domain-containing protein [Gammaproteobacteria bacterium]NIR84561.1 GGDEF domain-containing protein [Gammaproteobacteria bacterium]NIR90464.1 GGDEF domain-containing protein [Gammaproteobacteria bacterium]NIU05612.1 GGDEF domain-containing protein [Gammaproteobacteria bacterium]NIV52751.1 diguanylate cyclase [Gammaproteobacteria bacterium]